MQAGAVVGDRFVIERLAGSGGMGRVYRGTDRLTGKPVALKVLHAGAAHQRRFAREARILAELDHPGIVRYLAHGTTAEGDPYIAMEWLDGEDLGARIRRGIDPATSLSVIEQIARALEAAHKRGIVHRDLKPGNIMLLGAPEHPRVKVLDFGIVQTRDAEPGLTRTGAWIGTPGYMSPEQARGTRELDARSDIYSLGCILFRCLTGRTPFTSPDPVALLMKTVIEEPPRLRDVRPGTPPILDVLVASMLANDPNDRPADASALVSALEDVGTISSSGDVPSQPASVSLSNTERVLRCVVVARTANATEADGATIVDRPRSESDAMFKQLVALGGHPAALADGTMIVTVDAAGAATDHAARAARCALVIREARPEAAIAIVARSSDTTTEAGPVGSYERAFQMLERSAIGLDRGAASLIEPSFEVEWIGDRALLHGERSAATPRMLLGKPSLCVGRERELSMLRALYDECVDEPIVRLVVVTAAAGVGKSRLRDELLRVLRGHRHPPEVWLGRGDPMSAGSPYSLLATALRRASALGELSPRSAAFIGEMIGLRGDAPELDAARHDPALMNDQIRAAFVELVNRVTARRPVLLILEDLHHGDQATVKLIDAAARDLGDSPWMVLALARPEVLELFPRLWSERGVQEVRLEPLKKRASEQLVRHVLGEIDEERVRTLVQRAEGNAYYLEELLRAVAEGRQEDLPESVLAMSQARLEQLEPEARRLLRAASVFGGTFWRGGLLSLLGSDETTIDMDAWMSTLVTRELVVVRGTSRFEGEQDHAFRHGLLREAAYSMLTEEDRALGHRLAGDWLAPREADAFVVARHYDLGGEKGRAAELYARAAEQALTANELDLALERVKLGDACAPAGETLTALRLAAAEIHRWRGENAKVLSCAEHVLSVEPPGSIRWWRALDLVGLALARLGGRERMTEIAAMAEGAPDGPSREERAIAEVGLARCLLFFGMVAEAERAIARVDAATRGMTLGPRVEGKLHAVRAGHARMLGDDVRALAEGREALACYETAGDAHGACMFLVNVGYTEAHLGLFAEGEKTIREAIARSLRHGLRPTEGAARNNMGWAIFCQGRHEEALTELGRAIGLLDAMADVRMAAGARIHRSMVLASLGQLEGAELDARDALPGVQGFIPLEIKAHAQLSRVLLACGRNEEALRHAEEAMRRLESLSVSEEGEALTRLAYAEALRANGHDSTAAVERAKSRIRERAAMIAREDIRRAFLAMPDHVRTMAL